MKVFTFVIVFLLYTFGFILGILVENINFLWKSEDLNKPNVTKTEKNNPPVSIEDVKKIRILCFLNTRPASHGQRDVHIMKTWGKHCDKILFASTLTDINLGAIGFNVTDNHDTMWGKEKSMLKYIYDNFINDYDWFHKGDDDMFLIPENMRFLLAAYSPDHPIYFGHKFNTTAHKRGYFSGGSGYVMSRQTVRIFVEKILRNPDFYRQDESNGNVCHIENDKETEDWHISICLDYYDVYAGDSRDLVKRDRFFPFDPDSHLFGYPSSGYWYWQRKYYFNDEGLDCCSNYSIAYHYIGPRHQYTLYYLVYKLQPFGVQRQFPPPPKKKIFSDVIRILNEERINATLRGY